jgi:hypothetical protein
MELTISKDSHYVKNRPVSPVLSGQARPQLPIFCNRRLQMLSHSVQRRIDRFLGQINPRWRPHLRSLPSLTLPLVAPAWYGRKSRNNPSDEMFSFSLVLRLPASSTAKSETTAVGGQPVAPAFPRGFAANWTPATELPPFLHHRLARTIVKNQAPPSETGAQRLRHGKPARRKPGTWVPPRRGCT